MGGIESTKLHSPLHVRVDLGHFDAVGGIELTKVHPILGLRVTLAFKICPAPWDLVGLAARRPQMPGT